MANEWVLKEDIVEVCHRIYGKGYVASNDGNVSIRISENEILTTPTGMSKGYLEVGDIVKVDMDGNKIAGAEDRRPSSEVKLHIRVYKTRPDIKSVVHAHPPIATGFAVAGLPLAQCVLPEVVITIGSVPLAPYGTPSTEELPDTIMEYIKKSDAFLLANHGAMTIGTDVYKAYYRMETLEHFAHISLVAKQLGGVRTLTKEQVDRLMEIREELGIEGPNFSCETCGLCGGEVCAISDSAAGEKSQEVSEDEIARIVAERVKGALSGGG